MRARLFTRTFHTSFRTFHTSFRVRCFPGSTLAPQLLSSMNLRRMRRASFFLSLLPSTWFVLLFFCCGAMSLSALLSSKDERDKLIVARTPKKTVQATDFWLRSFQKYALESKNVPDLLALSKEKIGEVLECYFVDVRTKGGDMYSRNSYVSAKAAIQRWLSASMTINIFTDPEFKRANAVLDGLLKEKKRQGLEASVKHKDAISDADWKKIELHFADVLTANDPRKLCQFVWFHVTSASGFLFNAGNATFNNVTFNFAPPPPKKRKVSRERLQLKKTRERLLQSRTAEGEFSTAERTTVELSGSTSWSTKKSCF